MLVKCQYCGERDTERKLMEKISKPTKSGKPKNLYYHKGDCYESHIKEQEFKDREAEELDKLVDVILEVHDIDVIPSPFFATIQDLRNGSILFGRMRKRYKKGIPYSTIANTYRFCADSIAWAKKNRSFKNTTQELRYCWVIINDNVQIVKKKEEKKRLQLEKQKQDQDDQEALDQKLNTDIEYNKKRKDNSVDISDFLD